MARDSVEIIDPPVTAFSSAADIRAWIEELNGMEQTDAVKSALRSAERMLELQKEAR